MKKFTLNTYKDIKYNFLIFDVLIKSKASNIELFLEEMDISPSSYRRAKKEGNKIGETILDKLSKYFNYNLCSNELIDEIEEKINKIYYNIYYKYYDDYENHYKWLDEMINQKYIIFPIFKLFKLLMIMNDQVSVTFVIPENQELFNEIKLYNDYLSNGLTEIIELVDVTFKKDIDDQFLANNYNNELTHHTLASRCYVMKRYLESIYFCNKAKEKYIKDENYKRVYYINLALITNYNFLFKFEDAYLLAEKQLKTLESIKNIGAEYELTSKLYVVSCLGLKKYDEVISVLSKKERIKLSELMCLLISYYFTDRKEYDDLYNDLKSGNENSNVYKCSKILNDFLITNDKKIILEVEPYDINKCILEILKKM